MKTILVLTDFSKKARYAAETAVQLADKMDAAILLFNAYSSYPFLPSTEFVAWPPEYYSIFKEDSKIRIQQEEKRLEVFAAEKRNGLRKVSINYLIAEGSAAGNLPALLKKHEVEIVVIGGREKIEGSFLFGNEMNQIINKCTCPLLIVSSKQAPLQLKNVIFATDLDLNDLKAVDYLLELSKIFHFRLQVCHVSQPPVFLPDFDEEDRVSSFTNAISKLGFSNMSYNNVEGTHIAKELEAFSRKNHTDLFVLVQKKHSIFHKLLQESPAKLMIRHQKKPVLIIPEHWEY